MDSGDGSGMVADGDSTLASMGDGGPSLELSSSTPGTSVNGDDNSAQLQAAASASATDEAGIGVAVDDTLNSVEASTDGHGPDMYSMMVGGLYELDQALQESSKLLQAKETELQQCREERNRLKEVMAKEILRKTELSSLLEESRQHVIALEGLIERWQEEVRQVKQREESTRAQLTERVDELKKAREEAAEAQAESQATSEENTMLKKRIAELKKRLDEEDERSSRKGSSTSTGSETSEQDLQVNWAFLKTSVLHYFTDQHPYEQAKAIVSILNYSAQERKKIYAKLDEKFGRRQYAAGH